MAQTYPIREALAAYTQITGTPPARVLRRVGLPENLSKSDVPAQLFFDIWAAALAEADSPDAAFTLGCAMADHTISPAQLAFSASATLTQGIERLALFKPLVAPLSFTLKPSTNALSLTLRPTDPALKPPPELARFDAAYFLSIFRKSTGKPIVPLHIGLPLPAHATDRERAFFGRTPEPADALTLTLSSRDAALPLTSANTALLATLEPLLKQKLAAKTDTLAHRLHTALLEMLPSGQASLATAAQRLHMSRHSLQRGLQAEGLSFQALLSQARLDAAQNYLSRGDMSITEIAYLLAFRDANSFYRAFRTATGQTPNEARQKP